MEHEALIWMAMLDAEVLGWVESHLGVVEVVSRYAHDHGYSRLWRLRAGTDYFWLKMHTYPAKAAGEVHALVRWAPSLGLSPAVVAWRDGPRAVILTERPGFAAETVDLVLPAKMKMWEAAGDWLRRLHLIENEWFGGVREDGTPWGGMSTDPVEFVLGTFTRRIDEGEATGVLTKEEVEFARFGIREWVPALAGETPRAVHRDFTPRNWMCETDGTLTGIIDFEHARWDIRAVEMSRWWDWDFLRHPELIEVFFGAYGALDERLKVQVRAIRLLQATTGVVWATQVNDPGFAQHNRASVHRMMAENARAG
jgi:hypothetical protein